MNTFYVFRLAFHVSYGTGLAQQTSRQGKRRMTQAQRILLGAVGLGLAIVIYLIFFCPTDCQ